MKFSLISWEKKIKDEDIICLLFLAIDSFHLEQSEGEGIPLGNLTSQIFANIYLNELDQFVKHKLKVKSYLRYCDDFIFLSDNKRSLLQCTSTLKQFLEDDLKLKLHPNKVVLRRLDWGIDFLGYIVLPYYRLPRTKTVRRIFKKLTNFGVSNQSLQSYLGYLSHSNSYRISQELKNNFWLKNA